MKNKPRKAMTVDLDKVELACIHGGLQLLAQYRKAGEPLRIAGENTLARLTGIISHSNLFSAKEKIDISAEAREIIRRNHSPIILP